MNEHRSAVGATLAGVRDLFVRRRDVAPLPDDVRLDGRTALVTGGTTGLGRAVAEQLAARGARVVATGRTARGLPPLGDDARVVFAPVDLADLQTVHGFVKACRSHGYRFDRLIQNAGMVAQRSRTTRDGFDEMEQVNALAAAALFAAVWQAGLLVSSSTSPKPSRPRVIVVGSESHRSAEMPSVDAVGRPRDYGVGAAVAEYGRSKLLLTTWAMALARKLDGAVDVYAMCPGAVNSDIAREAPAWSRPLLSAVFTATFQSPAQAAEPVVYLACAPENEEKSGTYLHLMRRKTPSPEAMTVELQDAVWRKFYILVAEHGFAEPSAVSPRESTAP